MKTASAEVSRSKKQPRIAFPIRRRRCRRQLCRFRRTVGPRTIPGAAPSLVDEVLRSRGRPLEAGLRREMETRMGHDLADVRVHTDRRAGESARRVGAAAYTVGSDVVFAPGEFSAASTSGRRLLAHELVHVVQQRGGTRRAPLTISPEDTEQEREAADIAHRQDEGGETADDKPTHRSEVSLQRQSTGTFWLRWNGERVEVLYSPPKVPISGGFRCEGGKCQPVGGGDPSKLGRTYTRDEAVAELEKRYGSGGKGAPSGFPTTGCPLLRQLPFGGCCPPGEWVEGSRCVPVRLKPPWPIGRGGGAGARAGPGGPSPAGRRPAKPGALGTFPTLCLPASTAKSLGSATLDGFAFAGSEVPSGHSKTLAALAVHIKSALPCFSGALVVITGHTDAVGGPKKNLKLGRQRAEAVKKVLEAAGVPSDRMIVSTRGESLPVVETPGKEPRNRRVEVRFEVETPKLFEGPKLELEWRPPKIPGLSPSEGLFK